MEENIYCNGSHSKVQALDQFVHTGKSRKQYFYIKYSGVVTKFSMTALISVQPVI